jgi:hypothetical protein
LDKLRLRDSGYKSPSNLIMRIPLLFKAVLSCVL